MADKLQGTWVFGDDFTSQFAHNGTSKEWELDFESNGTRFSRLSINCFEFKNNIYNTNTLAGLGYYLPDGTFTRAYVCATDTVIRNPQYMTIYIHSKYAEVENADTLYQALTARATHTPVGEDIKVTMQSAKGVLLKTQDKFCEADILVTPELEELTVTENGEYTPSKVGYSKVSVSVEAPPASEPVIEPLTVTENGTYTAPDGVDGYSPVTVEVAASGGSEPTIDDLVGDKAVNVDLPTATKIYAYAFYKRKSLESVTASNATEIEKNAFEECSNLANVSLSSGLTSIGDQAFFKCTNLSLTSLPNGVTSIGGTAFGNCSNLALTSLPSGLTSISLCAFQNCKKLAITEIPSGVTQLLMSTFYGCTGLTSITFKGTPSLITTNAFNICTNLTTINVPWAEGAVSGAPWGATNATINYNYTGG